MGMWTDSPTPRYITDRTHPIIRREYEQRRQELHLRHDEEMSERDRRIFDRDMVERYSQKYPVPGYVKYLLMIWEFLPTEGSA